MPTFGVSTALSVEHCWPEAGNVQQKSRLKIQRWVFRVFRVFRVFWVFWVFRVFRVFWVFRVFRVFRVQCDVLGVVVGFNFGFGRTKTTRNVTWGLTPCRKMLKTAEN